MYLHIDQIRIYNIVLIFIIFVIPQFLLSVKSNVLFFLSEYDNSDGIVSTAECQIDEGLKEQWHLFKCQRCFLQLWQNHNHISANVNGKRSNINLDSTLLKHQLVMTVLQSSWKRRGKTNKKIMAMVVVMILLIIVCWAEKEMEQLSGASKPWIEWPVCLCATRSTSYSSLCPGLSHCCLFVCVLLGHLISTLLVFHFFVLARRLEEIDSNPLTAENARK